MITGNNFISANQKTAINTTGEMFNIGDVVKHQDTEVGIATIQKFGIDPKIHEVMARTDKGYAHIDFITKIN